MALKPFDKKVTEWEGLWYDNGTHLYTSAAINLKNLREFKGSVRLVIMKNKFYKKDTNRPNYVFRIQDTNSDNAKNIEVFEEQEEGGEMFVPLESAVEIARSLLHDMEYGYSIDDLIVEAERFMENAAVEAVPAEV